MPSFTYHVIYHKEVQSDINIAYSWYENVQPGLGERFLYHIHKKIGEIAKNPLTYGFKTNNIFREAMIEKYPYLIVYKVFEHDRTLFISSIHHMKKHQKNKIRKRDS